MVRRRAEQRVTELAAEGRRWDEQEAREVVAAWDASGESGAQFGRRYGIDPQRLWWWRGRLRDRGSSSFVPVEVTGAVPAAVVTIEDGTRTRIEVATVDGASAEWITTLVVGLRSTRS